MEVTTTPAPVATSDEAPWPFPRRFVALFTSPKALFEHLEHRPSWFVPTLVTLVFFTAYLVVLWNPVLLPEQLLRFEEQGSDQKMVDMMTNNGLMITLISTIPMFLLGTFVTALVVWGIGGFLLGGKLTYRQALSIVSHAGLIFLPSLAVLLPLALVSGRSQVSVGPGMLFNVQEAEGYAGRFIAMLTSFVDVFKLWQTALTALGISVIGRVARNKATVAMFVGYFVASLIFASVLALIPR